MTDQLRASIEKQAEEKFPYAKGTATQLPKMEEINSIRDLQRSCYISGATEFAEKYEKAIKLINSLELMMELKHPNLDVEARINPFSFSVRGRYSKISEAWQDLFGKPIDQTPTSI